MDIYTLNSSFFRVDVIDDFDSFIWVDHFRSPGTFTMQFQLDSPNVIHMLSNPYLSFSLSEDVMIIEDHHISIDDITNNMIITFEGHSVSNILSYRVFPDPKVYEGQLGNVINQMINDNLSNARPSKRQIRLIGVRGATSTPPLNTQVKVPVCGDNVGDVIWDLCEEYDIGIKIQISKVNFPDGSKKLEPMIDISAGRDRSRAVENSYIISEDSDRISSYSSSYITSGSKNVAYVYGRKDDGTEVVITVNDDISDIDRKEIYVEANDIYQDGATDAEFIEALKYRGLEELMGYKDEETYEFEIDPELGFDGTIKLGDLLTAQPPMEDPVEVRVTQILYSIDAEGLKIIPTAERVIRS